MAKRTTKKKTPARRLQVRAKIAVIIPCYNVSQHVEAVIQSLPKDIWRIIAVDDGSTDDTLKCLQAIQDRRLITVNQVKNRGVGAAMFTGYAVALSKGADICVKMDGDGQMDPEQLSSLTKPIINGAADYTKGNRFHDLRALRAMPRLRLIGNSMLSFLTKLVSGYWSVLDPANGYTAISAEALAQINEKKIRKRFFFETSLLIELNIVGAVVCDVPMPARYGKENSSLSIIRVLISFPFLLAFGALRRFYWRYLVKDFNALTLCVLLGTPIFLFGLAFGVYHWWQSGVTGTPATAGTVLVAALPVILGFQLLLTSLVLDILYQPRHPVSRFPWLIKK